MDKEIPFKKGKGAYLYDIKGNKYYDFRFNTNIIGYSNSKLTKTIKNHISSSWNIIGSTIYHKRLKNLFKNLFPDNFEIGFSYSLNDFFLYVLNQINGKYNYKIHGKRFENWFEKNINMLNFQKSEKNINIYDMAELYLDNSELKLESINILNYYWYPDLEIINKEADVIILPELFNGYFKYITILINKKSELYEILSSVPKNIDDLPSIYIASSLKLFYLIEKLKKEQKKTIIKLNWDNLITRGRIFSFNTIKEKEINKLCRFFQEKNIMLNNKPPYYNYLPLNLEEHQEKYLLRKIND